MVHEPDDPPSTCPVCDAVYDSVTVHADGVMVNLEANDRYQRVCFDPDTRDGDSVLYFYHHTHQQAASTDSH